EQVCGLERAPARQQFVQDRAERIDIDRGPGVVCLAAGLFRRHVLGRTQNIAALGVQTAAGFEVPGEPEVTDLGLEIRNPNIEIRNKSEIRMTETWNVRSRFGFWYFGFRVSFGFRYSDFGFGAKQNVCRLEIPMDDAALMGVVHRPRECLDELGSVAC